MSSSSSSSSRSQEELKKQNEMPDQIYLGKDSRGQIVVGEPCFDGDLVRYTRADKAAPVGGYPRPIH